MGDARRLDDGSYGTTTGIHALTPCFGFRAYGHASRLKRTD